METANLCVQLESSVWQCCLGGLRVGVVDAKTVDKEDKRDDSAFKCREAYTGRE